VGEALDAGVAEARRLIQRDEIFAAALCLHGEVRSVDATRG